MLDLLDRYVLARWLRIFAITVLGFPLVLILIDVVDHLSGLMDGGLTWREIALSYAYSIPANVLLVLPAAVLFATVFTVSSLGRYSELTAAKAGGRSFHRLVLPLFLAAAGATGLGLLGEQVAPEASRRQMKIQRGGSDAPFGQRYNFVYRAERGWVYTIAALDVGQRRLSSLLLERKGTGPDYPSLIITADSAIWDTTASRWVLHQGASRAVGSPDRQATFQFGTLALPVLRETPTELLAQPKAPEEMSPAELTQYIDALQRSGNDTAKLEVERALKVAVPALSLIIAIFGAPLAITSHRSGAAWGIAVSLGTTILFLLLAQIAKAVGAGGLVDPRLAAWAPNLLFLAVGLVLLARVRT